MKKTIFLLMLVCLATALVSCEKEEPNVILPDMGTVKNYRDSIPIPKITVTP